MVFVRRYARYWRAYIAVGGLVLVIFLSIVNVLEYKRQYNRDYTPAQKSASQSNTRTLVTWTYIGDPRCQAGQSATYQQDCENWQSMYAAEGQSRWAFWTFVLGVCGTIAILVTLHFTRIGTQAGVRAAQIASDQFKSTARARVFLDGFNDEITTADQTTLTAQQLPEGYREKPHLFITRYAIQPRWKNGGSTPTKNMRIQIHWGLFEQGVNPSFSYQNAPVDFFIAPGAVEPSPFVEIPPIQRLVDAGLNAILTEPTLLIWGRATYEDIFSQNNCFTEWCYILRLDSHDGRPIRATFTQWGDYNRTEETNPQQP